MNGFISYQKLLPFGTVVDGILEISNSFSIDFTSDPSAECIKVTALSQSVGKESAHIVFLLTAKGQADPFYTSHRYDIGEKEQYVLQSWRIPPFFLPDMTLTIRFDLPEGTTLKLRSFTAEYSTPTREWNGGLRHNAHLGFWGLAPDNTMPAFELAAACGFPACIVVPKVTKDGVLVCIHDDTINRTARDQDGNSIEQPLAVSDLTYQELLKWDFGSYKNEIYKGTRIPLLEDFFALCSRTGMRPMFSTHPALTTEQWKQVKEMLIRHGLLHLFHIKSFRISTLQTAYSVFGTEIDGYTWDNKEWEEGKVEELQNAGIDTAKCRVGMEFMFHKYTEEIAKKVIAGGFFAAAWDIERTTGAEYKRLISYGVTEFTEDFHCSMGLNW